MALARKGTIAGIAALVCAAVLLSALGSWLAGNEAPPDPQFETATVIHVSDGDTLLVSIGGEERYVRFLGCDAPESVNPDESLNCPEGAEASEYLRARLSRGDTVFLQRDVSETDKFDRLLRYVWTQKPTDPFDEHEISEKMLSAVMVRAGYAQATRFQPDVLYSGVLERLQKMAVEEGAGVSWLWNR